MIWKLSAKVCTRYSIFDLYITAHVTTLILNRFIQINFSVGCMIWPWCWLFQDRLPVKILIRWTYSKSIVGAGFVVRFFSLTTFFKPQNILVTLKAMQCQLLDNANYFYFFFLCTSILAFQKARTSELEDCYKNFCSYCTCRVCRICKGSELLLFHWAQNTAV